VDGLLSARALTVHPKASQTLACATVHGQPLSLAHVTQPGAYLKNAGTCSITTLDGLSGSHFFPVAPSTAVFGIGGPCDEVVVRDGAAMCRRILIALRSPWTTTCSMAARGGPLPGRSWS